MLRIDGERKRQGQLSLRVARGQFPAAWVPYASTQFIHGTKMHRLIHTLYIYGNPMPVARSARQLY